MSVTKSKIWILALMALLSVTAIACEGESITVLRNTPMAEPDDTAQNGGTSADPTATPSTGGSGTTPTATASSGTTAQPTVAPTSTTTPPPPEVSIADTSGPAPLTVQFGISDDPNIGSVEWDFGDGATSDELSPEHTFAIAGTTTVNLTVTDTNGNVIVEQTTSVEVSPGEVASITVSPADAITPVLGTIQFSATAEDRFGNSFDITPEWSVAGSEGELSGSGVFTAGTVSGTFSGAIVASAQGDSGAIAVSV